MLGLKLTQLDQKGGESKVVFSSSTKETYSIGRSEECDFVIPKRHDQVSGIHGSLTLGINDCIYQHKGRNMAKVNGVIVDGSTKIENGDIIELTTEGPQFKVGLSGQLSAGSLVSFFQSSKVVYFYLALILWAVATILYFNR